MIRLISLSLTLLCVSNATAQQNCPGGVCPTTAKYAPVFSQLGPTPVGNPPSAQHEWKVIPGHGYGWGLKSVESGPPAPGIVLGDEPNVVEGRRVYRANHGRLFYRIVKDRVYKGLIEKGVSEDEARAKVESLSLESIDVYGQQAGIVGQIGDGKILQWLSDHREEILRLIMFIITILMAL